MHCGIWGGDEPPGPQFEGDEWHYKGYRTRKGQLFILSVYREQLRLLIPPLVAKWEAVLGVRVSYWGIRRMQTRWGTCNADAGGVWLNLELVKKPMHCLEYVLVHEMVHLLERHHNERFLSSMDHFVPQWRLYRDELNAAPLAHETWNLGTSSEG